jgi:hypothetical protein
MELYQMNAPQMEITPNFDKFSDKRPVKYFFKKVVDKETKEEFKRPTVELELPVPSVEGLVEIITQGGKGLELLLDAAAEVVIGQARSIVNDKEDISQENFPLDKITWEYIANLPKAERRGGGISKETWEAFSDDYVAVMPSVTGKTAEQVANAAKILMNKFNLVKANKPVLKLLKEQLTIYVNNSPNAETYTECVEFLVNKADALLAMDEAALLANL